MTNPSSDSVLCTIGDAHLYLQIFGKLSQLLELKRAFVGALSEFVQRRDKFLDFRAVAHARAELRTVEIQTTKFIRVCVG